MKSFKPGELVTYRYKLTNENACNFYRVLNDEGDGGVVGYTVAHFSDKKSRGFIYTGYIISTLFLGDRKYLRRTRSNENFCISLAFFYEKLDD